MGCAHFSMRLSLAFVSYQWSRRIRFSWSSLILRRVFSIMDRLSLLRGFLIPSGYLLVLLPLELLDAIIASVKCCFISLISPQLRLNSAIYLPWKLGELWIFFAASWRVICLWLMQWIYRVQLDWRTSRNSYFSFLAWQSSAALIYRLQTLFTAFLELNALNRIFPLLASIPILLRHLLWRRHPRYHSFQKDCHPRYC